LCADWIIQRARQELQSTERVDESNAQTVYCEFKEKVFKRAKTRDNEIVPKIIIEENQTKDELDETSKSNTLSGGESSPDS
jgi:hypothetical protein